MFQIDKQFDFCYGHRVHNQKLDPLLSDGLCKCRHLHGHNGRLKVGLKSHELVRGMVTDFKNLECIKRLVDDILDHKFIIDIADPLFNELFNDSKDHIIINEYGLGYIDTDYINDVVSAITDKDLKEATYDKLMGVVIVDFVPTSENLCKMFGDVCRQVLKTLTGERVQVSYIDFWETPKSHCRYEIA